MAPLFKPLGIVTEERGRDNEHPDDVADCGIEQEGPAATTKAGCRREPLDESTVSIEIPDTAREEVSYRIHDSTAYRTPMKY